VASSSPNVAFADDLGFGFSMEGLVVGDNGGRVCLNAPIIGSRAGLSRPSAGRTLIAVA